MYPDAMAYLDSELAELLDVVEEEEEPESFFDSVFPSFFPSVFAESPVFLELPLRA